VSNESANGTTAFWGVNSTTEPPVAPPGSDVAGVGESIIAMIIIPLSFILLVRKVIGQVVREKETGMKE
jgi:hypothetical protein